MATRSPLLLFLALPCLFLTACANGPGPEGIVDLLPYSVEAARLQAIQTLMHSVTSKGTDASAIATDVVEFMGGPSPLLSQTLEGQLMRSDALTFHFRTLDLIPSAEEGALFAEALERCVGPVNPAFVALPAMQARRARALAMLCRDDSVDDATFAWRIELAARLIGPLDEAAMAGAEGQAGWLDGLVLICDVLPFGATEINASVLSRYEGLVGPSIPTMQVDAACLANRFDITATLLLDSDDKTFFDRRCAMVERYQGPLPDSPALADPEVRTGRLQCLSGIHAYLAKNPDDAPEIVARYLRFFGPPFEEDRSERCQCARLQHARTLFGSVARYFPDRSDHISACIPLFGSPEWAFATWTEQSLHFYLRSMREVFRALGSQPLADTRLREAMALFFGPPPVEKLRGDQLRTQRSQNISPIFDCIARQPDMATSLRALALHIFGPSREGPDSSDEIQASRLGLANELLKAGASKPECLPTLLDTLEELTWVAVPGKLGEQCRSSLGDVEGGFYAATASQPTMEASFDAALLRILGQPMSFDGNDDGIRMARQVAITGSLPLHGSLSSAAVFEMLSRRCGPAIPFDSRSLVPQAARLIPLAQFFQAHVVGKIDETALEACLDLMGPPSSQTALASELRSDVFNSLSSFGGSLNSLSPDGEVYLALMERLCAEELPPVAALPSHELSWSLASVRQRCAGDLILTMHLQPQWRERVATLLRRHLGEWTGVMPREF